MSGAIERDLQRRWPFLPSAGKPAPERDADRSGPARTGVLRAPARSRATPTSWSASAPADIAARRCDGTFTEAHILAITQAICDYRRAQGTDGPLYMGKDTHALSGPAQRTALEVLAANGVETIIQRDDGVTPTPVISRAILVYNRGRERASRGRHRHHAVAQSARGRRLQVQPDQRRPGRHRRDQVGRGPRQRTAARAATPG